MGAKKAGALPACQVAPCKRYEVAPDDASKPQRQRRAKIFWQVTRTLPRS